LEKYHSKNSGFFLIEALLSIALITGALAFSSRLYIRIFQQTDKIRTQYISLILAQNELEKLLSNGSYSPANATTTPLSLTTKKIAVQIGNARTLELVIPN